jgi:hypothetical protein
LGRKFVEQLLDRNAPGARAAGIARIKRIDDKVTQALEIATQLILLGPDLTPGLIDCLLRNE